MITIGTNIFKKISQEHKGKIASLSSLFVGNTNEFEITDYEAKAMLENGIAKFFIGDFPLYKISQDIELWDSFVELLQNIFLFSKQDFIGVKQVQFFIMFNYISTPVNIFFSVKEQKDLMNLTIPLKEELKTQVFQNKNLENGKTVVLGYDNENGVWQFNYL